jgi:hypothetical protein
MNLDLEIEILKQSHEPWLLMLVLFYYLTGFITVREIYATEEDRLGANPFDRMSHVLIFVGLAALIWPVVWLNHHFRDSESDAGKPTR